MRETHTEIYVHLIWATWDRLPLITADVEKRLYAEILAECHSLKCSLLTIGGTTDHVHLLVQLLPSVSVSDLLKQVKGSTSHLMTHEVKPGEFFKWQGAYGAFSVGRQDLKRVTAYIEAQKVHHQSGMAEEWEV